MDGSSGRRSELVADISKEDRNRAAAIVVEPRKSEIHRDGSTIGRGAGNRQSGQESNLEGIN